MRHAVIMAGGAGTRLWPMSRAHLPKQLIPFINGRSLLQVAYERLEGLVPPENRFVCAGEKYREAIVRALHLPAAQFIGEPTGRDTLNAVGLSAAVIGKRDPEAVVAVFTADHIIEPVDRLLAIVDEGYRIAETLPSALVTFGIQPTTAATSYGYLELGEACLDDLSAVLSAEARSAKAEATGGNVHAEPSRRRVARVVRQFKEKPDAATAERYFADGPTRYLWNSGMFVWRASTVLECIRRYTPDNAAGLRAIADAWDTPRQDAVVGDVFPALKKISVDFAVMEPASRDPEVRVVAVPMPLTWLDVGSWPMFAETCAADEHGNRLAAASTIVLDTTGTLVASSDPSHLVAAVGCRDLIIVHTPDATLVCDAASAEKIKDVHKLVGERWRDLV